MMRPLRDEVHDYVHAIEDRTTKLFTRIAEEGSLERSGTVLDTIAWDDVLSMTQAQTELVKLVEMTALHQENQSRIDALIESIKACEERQRRTISLVNELQTDLLALLRHGEREAENIRRAEVMPISSKDILEYAQRLARYTSAPRGYTLESLTTPAAEPHQPGQGSGQKGDYNDQAERAKFYYDPVMPTTPHELPFPSDRLMRQGILYADAASSTTESARDIEHDTTNKDAVGAPAEEVKDIPVLDSFAMDEDDAFDLDLNP